jgi:hypothetical protein
LLVVGPFRKTTSNRKQLSIGPYGYGKMPANYRFDVSLPSLAHRSMRPERPDHTLQTTRS